MKKILLISFLLAFVALPGINAQNGQRTRTIGSDKFRSLIENYKPSSGTQDLKNPSGSRAIIYAESFDTPGLDLPAGWTSDGSSSSCTWKMDATPAYPGYFSGIGSLNFNNGTDFNCDSGDGNGTWGTVTSPLIDVAGQPCTISFMFNTETECNGGGGGPDAPGIDCGWDQTWIYIYDENGNQLEFYFVDGTNAWNLMTYPVQNPGGSQFIRIEFYFDSYDSIGNTFYGPFIDDLTVSEGVIPTPVSNWAIVIGISLIVAFTFFRIKQRFNI